MEITSCHYRGHSIKAGQLPGQSAFLARAFAKAGKPGAPILAEAQGPSAEAAIEAVKAKLDALDAARRTARRIHPATGLAVPSAEEYESALRQVALSEAQIAMLKAHAAAGEAGLTAGALARAAGYPNFETANSIYGKAGRAIGDHLNLPAPQSTTREGDVATMLLAYGGPAAPDTGHFVWVMYPELREAVAAAL